MGERIGAHRRPPARALCVWQIIHTFEAFPRAQQMLCAGGMQLALNHLYHRGVKIVNSNDLTQVIKPALQTEKAINYWALEKVNGDVTPDLESGGREGRWPRHALIWVLQLKTLNKGKSGSGGKRNE